MLLSSFVACTNFLFSHQVALCPWHSPHLSCKLAGPRQSRCYPVRRSAHMLALRLPIFVLRGSSRVLFNQVSAAAHAAELIVATFVNTLFQVVHLVPPESARLLPHRSSASRIIPLWLTLMLIPCKHYCVAYIDLQLLVQMQVKKMIKLFLPYSALHCSKKWHCQASFETLGLDLLLSRPGDMQR